MCWLILELFLQDSFLEYLFVALVFSWILICCHCAEGSIWSEESPGHFGCSGLEEREGVKLLEGEVSRSGYGKCVWFMLV